MTGKFAELTQFMLSRYDVTLLFLSGYVTWPLISIYVRKKSFDVRYCRPTNILLGHVLTSLRMCIQRAQKLGMGFFRQGECFIVGVFLIILLEPDTHPLFFMRKTGFL